MSAHIVCTLLGGGYLKSVQKPTRGGEGSKLPNIKRTYFLNDPLLKINKRENRENNNIYDISYKINKPKHNINSINNLYFVVDHLYGMIEKINGSKDGYLVIDKDILMNEKFFFVYGNQLLIKFNI